MTTILNSTAKMPGQSVGVELTNEGVAVVTIDAPGEKLNTLTSEMCEELKDILEWLESSAEDVVGVVFISDKPDNFIAGADVKIIAGIQSAVEGEMLSREIQALFNRLENLPMPTVAAIHGPCLGGGLELALACRYRMVTNDAATQLGLPEVQLGILPGAGGTQRLPRLIGLKSALDIILAGKRIRASSAVKLGLADEMVPAPLLLERARTVARRLGAATRKSGVIPIEPASVKRVATSVPDLLLQATLPGRMLLYRQAKAELQKKVGKNYPAPYLALCAVFYTRGHSFEEGLELEARFFGKLAVTDVAKNLIRLFFATTALKNERYKSADGGTAKPREVNKVGVLGGGLMGGGIATVLVDKEYHVRVKDRDLPSASKALAYANKYLSDRVKKRHYRPYEKDLKMGLLSATDDYSGFGRADLVVEAVFEDVAVKHDVLREVEAVTSKDCIFATNTSSIPIARIAEASGHPETVVGMHFFSPVEKMPLLEVIVGPKTADWVAATVVAVGKKMGKHVIVVKDGPGFYTSRTLGAMMGEAIRLFLEGASVESIDSAITGFGFPVGGMTLIDEVGWDIAFKVTKILTHAFPDRFDAPPEAAALLASGRLGRKNGRGFYRYDPMVKKGLKTVDDTVYHEVVRSRRQPSQAEIRDRCVYAFLNEAALILQEGILQSPRDGDIGAVFGLGFPPFLGGPFRYMDSLGVERVVSRMRQLQDFSNLFAPAALLEEMAEHKSVFYPDGK